MPTIAANSIDISYEVAGDAGDPALLLVNGLGGQLTAWDDDLVQAFVDRGFHVVRFDNRDTGLSTKFSHDADVATEIAAAFTGQAVDAPYRLSDMAADAAALLDAIGVEAAHVLGVSMGGMIVQTMAIEQRHKILSMTSIMSTTGDPDVGQPDASVLPVLLEAAPPERAAFIEHQVVTFRKIGSPEHFEEDRVRRRAADAFDRCFNPIGVGHQLLAVIASGSRSAALAEVEIDALVIHGDADPLVNVSGGRRTAESIAGAELMVLEGMGHDLPTFFWSAVIESVTRLASRSAA